MASRRILALVLFLPMIAAGQHSISFTFTIPGAQDANTSAAVLDQNGFMVRTLWANVGYPPGRHTGSWDGKTDSGADSPPNQNYTIKLMTNNVSYTYDGHLGGTDQDWYTTHNYSHWCGWQWGWSKIAFSGKKGWIACGYAEVMNMIMTFDKSRPNYPSQANPSYKAAAGRVPHEAEDITTDNQWVYVMERGIGGNVSFVTAIDATSGMPAQFSQGTMDNGTLVWFNPRLSSSYIDPVAYSANNFATGIAVQRTGNILAVAHGLQSYIALFDKTTGASLGKVSGVAGVTGRYNWGNMTNMAFTSDGLWYVGGNHQLYLITGLPSSPVISQPISGLQYVAAIGANTLNNVLYVADGGTKQQIYGYAPVTHAKVRTYGTAGGYNDCNPSITHDRLQLDSTATMGINRGSYPSITFVAADDDDHLWIQDMDGARIQHIDQNGRYVDQILYSHPNYWVGASETMPTRLFIHWLEYTIDYTKTNIPGDGDPAAGGSGAWVLSKNWKVCAAGANGSPLVDTDFYYMISVERLSNGNVYMVPWYHLGKWTRYIYQLPNSGTRPMRSTGVVIGRDNFGRNGWGLFSRTGDVFSSSVSGSWPNKTVSVKRTPLAGFDDGANPIYGEMGTVATTTTNASNVLLLPNATSPPWGAEPSSGGYYPVIQTDLQNIPNYPHIAAFRAGASTYNWTAGGELCGKAADMHGHFPCHAPTSPANGVIRTEGRTFLFAYIGNYSPFGGQFYHYYEDGMMIGQFGRVDSYPGIGTNQLTRPAQFSNSMGFSTTTYNGDIYVYTGDEAFAMVHRWRISNLNSIHEYSGTAALETNGLVSLTKLF